MYLDNNATTMPARECVEAMMTCLHDCYGNPSSKHRSGEKARQYVSYARARVAQLLGAAASEIVFTSCATESNHQAILGGLALNPEKRHVVTSSVEHPSILLLLKHLESQGIRMTKIGVDSQGQIDLAELESAIEPDTALVSMQWANNETGVIFPVIEAAEIARSKGCLFHTDAVQAVGKLPIDLSKSRIDLLSLSGHKFHAPKGVGVLYMKKGIQLPSLLFGHQERGRRGGTENVPALAGLGAASELAEKSLNDGEVKRLRDRLEAGVLKAFPFVRVNGGKADRVGNTSNMRFGNMPAEAIVDRLDKSGIATSLGAACTAGGTEPSHVLSAMGLDKNAALASIRFSLSRYTTDDEINTVLEILPDIVGSLAVDQSIMEK